MKSKKKTDYRRISLGRPAVFYIPSQKAKEKNLDLKIRDFLIKTFGGCTASLSNFCGWWKNAKSKDVYYDEHIEFRVAFLGKNRIPILEKFLAKIARWLDEKCVYLETEEDSWLIVPKRSRKTCKMKKEKHE